MNVIDYDTELKQAIEPGSDSLTVSEQWQALPGVAFGGFVVAAMFWAASRAADDLRPLSVHARFHAPVPVGRELRFTMQALRRGRNVAVFDTNLLDGDVILTTASAAFGRNTTSEFDSLNVSPMPPLRDPLPIWKILEDADAAPERITTMVRRLGHRRTRVLPDPKANGGWHLENDWPATSSTNPGTRAAVAIMCTDGFVLPATLAANGRLPERKWPVVMRTLDLAAWFHDLGTGDEPEASDRLLVRTSVPMIHAGYALGRSEVWRGRGLSAEGMSHVTLQSVRA